MKFVIAICAVLGSSEAIMLEKGEQHSDNYVGGWKPTADIISTNNGVWKPTYETIGHPNTLAQLEKGDKHSDNYVGGWKPTADIISTNNGVWKPVSANSGHPNTLVQMQADPVENHCTNPSKATGEDQDCSAPGNSAWTTFSTSRTAEPKDAQAAPYPGHTLH